MAAGVTLTEIGHTSLKKIVATFEDDADGVSATTTGVYDGLIVGLTTDPDGVAAPADNWDVTVTDADSHDVLLGAGLNRDTANTEHVSSGMAGVAGSKLTFNVTNAGAGAKGVIVLWIR